MILDWFIITWYIFNIFMRQIWWWHVADPDMPLINQKHELYSYGSIARGLHSALRGTRGLEEEPKAQDGISQQFSQEQFWFERSFFKQIRPLHPWAAFRSLRNGAIHRESGCVVGWCWGPRNIKDPCILWLTCAILKSLRGKLSWNYIDI